MKSEKGFTGVDIVISVIILFIFISLIAFLSYNISSTSKDLELKSEATALAIEEIEKIKNMSFENLSTELSTQGIQYGTTKENAELQEIKDGYCKKINNTNSIQI